MLCCAKKGHRPHFHPLSWPLKSVCKILGSKIMLEVDKDPNFFPFFLPVQDNPSIQIWPQQKQKKGFYVFCSKKKLQPAFWRMIVRGGQPKKNSLEPNELKAWLKTSKKTNFFCKKWRDEFVKKRFSFFKNNLSSVVFKA